MATITTYYPSSTTCDSCHNGNSCAVQNTGGCSGCNTCNTTCQTVCEISQYIKNHANVGAYPGTTIATNDIISQKWTVDFFTSLNDKLSTAENVGLVVSQGTNGSFTNPQHNDIITAKLYNDIEQKIAGFVKNVNNTFVSDSYPTVQINDLITATVANAIQTAYEAAQFKTSVCDMCNAGEVNCACNCSCSCSCACPCPCDCECPCPCSDPPAPAPTT